MKAKEYAEQYRSWIGKRLRTDYRTGAPKGEVFDAVDGLICTCQAMTFEVTAIAESRNTQNDRAVGAIFREQDKKYQAFIRLVPEANGATIGFRKFVANQLPNVARMLGWLTQERSEP